MMSRKEYEAKLNKFNLLKSKLSNTSKSKISAAYNDPGNMWHDNFAYEQLDLQEDAMLNQIAELMDTINFAKIVEPNAVSPNCVDIYDKVELLFMYDSGEVEELVLTLGDTDGDDNITLCSPLGTAIYNQPYGTIISYFVNQNKIQVKIQKKL
ncbi:MAG: hypothetical protein ACLU8V_05905 [Oscillospiraceae bacterium]